MGSAILEAIPPVFEIEPNAETPGYGGIRRHMPGYSPNASGGVADLLPDDELKFQNENPNLDVELEAGHQGCMAGLGHSEPEETAPFAANSWPSAQEEIPLSPGAALLQEFDAIYQKYERRVYRQCLRMMRNPEDAEDLTQEVFLQLFRKAHTFRGESNFSTWLHRLTVNTVLMRLRRLRRWRDAVTSFDTPPGPDQDAGDVLTIVGTFPAAPTSPVDKISLDIAIGQLSSGYREIFLLHDAEGYRHDEIAKMLGISEGTSKSQLHKARFKLRELIKSSRNSGRSVQRENSVRPDHKVNRACARTETAASKERRPKLAMSKARNSSKRHNRRRTLAGFQGE
jgi:RNA polymerase sigma-70 factor (ECF subfamily)